MTEISYTAANIAITAAWILARAAVWAKTGRLSRKREAQLLPVYICIMVVARFTFFPFSRVDGHVQPLLFSGSQMLPPRVNFVPLVNLLDYQVLMEAKVNVIGNIAMFVPLGIIWPNVFRELDRHGKVLAAGAGFSLFIELLQLPFFDRVTDVDDLILNSLGFCLGYGLYLLFRRKKEAS